MKKLGLLFSLLLVPLLGEAALKINPVTGRLDRVDSGGSITLSTNTSGASSFIWNQSTLQTPAGAGFNVSSGTISGSDGFHHLDFVSDSIVHTGSDQIRIYQDVFGSKTLKGKFGQRLSSGDPFIFSDGSSNQAASIFTTTSRASQFNYGVDVSNTGYFGFKPRGFSSNITISYGGGYFYRSTSLTTPVTVTLPQVGQITDPVESASFLICKNDTSTNTISFAASSGDGVVAGAVLSSIGECVLFVSSVTNGTDTGTWYHSMRGLPTPGSVGRAVVSNSLGSYSIGLASAASNTTQNNFPMGDANGSLQPSSLNYLASYPIFTGSVVYGDNILAIGDMGGLTASLINGALNAKMSFGVGSGFTTSYRVNFPDTPLGAYQAWVSTGPTGNEFQLRNTTVIISTGSLQPGATFYVSSGTVSGQLSVNSIKWPDGTIQVSSPSAGGGGSGFTNAVNVAQFTSTRVLTVGGTTLEKSLIGFGIGSTTFTANTFTQGYTFRVKAMGHYEKNSANSVFRFKFAGLDVANSGTQTLGTSGVWSFDSLVTIQSTGTNGSFVSQSYFFPQISGSDIMYGLVDLSTSAINTTVSNYVDLTLEFDVNDSTVTVTNFLIDSLVVSTNTLGMSPGATYYIQNTDVLQTSATFYVSSGTVTNVSVATITFNDASKLATAPEKEYWWPGAATMPLEATGDNVAAASISTGTNFDVMEASFDSATDECRQVSFFVSTNSLVSVSTVTFGVRWFSLTATSGNTGWYFKHNSGVRSGESWDQTPQAHSSSFDAVGGTARVVTHTEWDVAVSSLTWRGGDVVEGGFCRDADNGSDTMSGDAKAEGFWIRFKRQ